MTLGDLYNIVPMNPSISRVTLTGAELAAMLEENLERTFAADPFEQMGGYIKRCRPGSPKKATFLRAARETNGRRTPSGK